MLRFACPGCHATLEAPDGRANTKTQCPGCGQRLRIPAPPPNRTVLAPLVSHTPGGSTVAWGRVAFWAAAGVALLALSAILTVLASSALNPAGTATAEKGNPPSTYQQGQAKPPSPEPAKPSPVVADAGKGSKASPPKEEGGVPPVPPKKDKAKLPPKKPAAPPPAVLGEEEKTVRDFILDHANDAKSVQFVRWGPNDPKADLVPLVGAAALEFLFFPEILEALNVDVGENSRRLQKLAGKGTVPVVRVRYRLTNKSGALQLQDTLFAVRGPDVAVLARNPSGDDWRAAIKEAIELLQRLKDALASKSLPPAFLTNASGVTVTLGTIKGGPTASWPAGSEGDIRPVRVDGKITLYITPEGGKTFTAELQSGGRYGIVEECGQYKVIKSR
jgi:hypothetical protein